MKNNFSIIYHFTIHEEFENEFIQNWFDITKLIYENKGSLGSRLQKIDNQHFLGYAIWPSKEVFENASRMNNDEINRLNEKQKKCVQQVSRVFESEILVDYIHEYVFQE